MINILIAAFGVVLIIAGFYAMSFGFSNPPNISFFFIGLILTVLGAMLVIIFGGRVNTADFKSKSGEKKVSKGGQKAKPMARPKPAPKKTEIPESPRKIQPKIAKKSKEPTIKKLVTDKKDFVGEKKIIPKKIEPKRVSKEAMDKPVAKKIEKPAAENKTESAPAKIRPVAKKIEKPAAENKAEAVPDKPAVKNPALENNDIKPVSKEIKPVKKIESKEKSKPFMRKTPVNKPKFVMGKNKSSGRPESEDEYVKNRLNRLKENYIKNAKDIENLIEERLDSFKGTLDQIKSESNDPSIIWSFNAGDVQGTMQDTILKADKKILMMYPWVRNIDVSVLKRFMETDSRIILQEASLDDDASVELIKLLMENNVEIRTMPHVHTVAIVSDENNGLIISTDPIYESFEVGVIYKDQKSIEEIERMFEEAWELSQKIDLNLN